MQNWGNLFPETNGKRLIGVAEERHIYEEGIPSLHQIEDMEIGSTIVALIRDVRVEQRALHISLTLLNSRIAGSEQLSLQGEKIFNLLGLQQGPPLPELGGLEYKMSQLGLSPYAIANETIPLSDLQRYDPRKVREAQNLQWADDLFSLA